MPPFSIKTRVVWGIFSSHCKYYFVLDRDTDTIICCTAVQHECTHLQHHYIFTTSSSALPLSHLNTFSISLHNGWINVFLSVVFLIFWLHPNKLTQKTFDIICVSPQDQRCRCFTLNVTKAVSAECRLHRERLSSLRLSGMEMLLMLIVHILNNILSI